MGGNVVANAPKDSVGISLDSKGGAVPKLVVAGTVRAGTAGLEFDGDRGASYDVTVWKIEVSDGGKLVRVGDKVDKTPESLASQIKYIIKIEQPKEGGRLYALNGQDSEHGRARLDGRPRTAAGSSFDRSGA